MEYGSTVWQTISRSDLGRLENIQKKALALCLDQPLSASKDALEVAAGILPQDLRLNEMAIRDIAKIAAKPQGSPLREKLNEYLSDDSWERIASPIGLAVSQVMEMKSITGIGVEFIQPEPEFQADALVHTIEKPTYWSQLGSSKTELQNSRTWVKKL